MCDILVSFGLFACGSVPDEEGSGGMPTRWVVLVAKMPWVVLAAKMPWWYWR